MLERIRFRRWWQPPRRASDHPEERRVTFLELFYDLVYVVIIAELSHALARDISLAGVGIFVLLFIIVWWAWFNGAMYHDLHGNNDIRTRVFTFLQMLTVAAMAVIAHNAIGEGPVGFALWVLALLSDLVLLFLLWTYRSPTFQEARSRVVMISPSAVERFGLFTIIVLGEVIVGVVSGVAGHSHLTWLVGGVLVMLAGLLRIGILPLLLVLNILLLAPVLYGILVWIKVFDARELEM